VIGGPVIVNLFCVKVITKNGPAGTASEGVASAFEFRFPGVVAAEPLLDQFESRAVRFAAAAEVGEIFFVQDDGTRANQLFDQGNKATKPEDATNLYRQAVQAIVDDQPSIWTYIEKTVLVHRADIEGFYTTMFFPETHVFTLKRTGK